MAATSRRDGKRSSDRWNDVFEALSAAPRRRLVGALLEVGPGDAVHLPAAATPPDGGDADGLRAALYHRHLPALAEAGFVDWETDPLVAVRGPDFEVVADVLEAVDPAVDADVDSLAVDWREGTDDGRPEEEVR